MVRACGGRLQLFHALLSPGQSESLTSHTNFGDTSSAYPHLFPVSCNHSDNSTCRQCHQAPWVEDACKALPPLTNVCLVHPSRRAKIDNIQGNGAQCLEAVCMLNDTSATMSLTDQRLCSTAVGLIMGFIYGTSFLVTVSRN